VVGCGEAGLAERHIPVDLSKLRHHQTLGDAVHIAIALPPDYHVVLRKRLLRCFSDDFAAAALVEE